MTLSDVGEARVNGYLFVLQRSLKTFLPPESARDAVREIESHLRERIAATDASPNERDVLERILLELGPPLRVAQAYSAEHTIEEAVTTGHLVPTLRAMWHLAATTVTGFVSLLGLFMAYVGGVACLVVAAIKPIFPDNVGFWYVHGIPIAIGARFPAPPPGVFGGGYWIIPILTVWGMTILVLAQRSARRYLTWWSERRSS
jgi:uncharacterized membrane protein